MVVLGIIVFPWFLRCLRLLFFFLFQRVSIRHVGTFDTDLWTMQKTVIVMA